MVSTYLTYRSYTADTQKSLARTAANPAVSREAKYYKENIGKIKTVDEFLKNRRLYAYAAKAYGLEDMVDAKAFMRKVLLSDVSDPKSFVRKLIDPRYLAFAKAFNFTPAGAVAPGVTVAQESADEEDTIGLYSEQRVRQGVSAASDAKYYQEHIATVQSVDDLINDPRLFSYALRANRIDPEIASKAAIRDVLTSDLQDPASTANRLGPRYQALAAAFSFQADGSLSGAAAQSASQITDTVFANYENSGLAATPPAAALKTTYYTDHVAGIASVDDLLNDDKLLSYVLTAFGVTAKKQDVRNILTSDLSDPNSFANKSPSEAYRKLAAAFNFAADGTLPEGVDAQSAAQRDLTTSQYLANYDGAAVSQEKFDTAYYRLNIATVKSSAALVQDDRLYNYVLKAFGIDPSEVSKDLVRQILQSDTSSPASFVNLLRDERFTALNKAFNFSTAGTAQAPHQAQIASSKAATEQLYKAQAGTTQTAKDQAATDGAYYDRVIGTIQDVDAFLNDKQLVRYALKAYGFKDEAISNSVLRQALTSDPMDPKSFVNTSPNQRFRELAAAYNFGSDGKAGRILTEQAQDRDDLLRTSDLYLRQTMEADAGGQNEGARLALYFQRKASSLTSAYSILADKAIFQVVRTALGLPDAMSQSDIDAQAKMITRKLNLADFQDPKKVERFLARFSAMHDINNAGSQPSLASMLFGTQENDSFNTTLLMAQLGRITR